MPDGRFGWRITYPHDNGRVVASEQTYATRAEAERALLVHLVYRPRSIIWPSLTCVGGLPARSPWCCGPRTPRPGRPRWAGWTWMARVAR
jgi:hypothetical protein